MTVNGKLRQPKIGKQPLDRYLAPESEHMTVTRAELRDILGIFIDKASFAQAMDSLDANIKLAIQGCVLEELGNLMMVEAEGESPMTPGGIILPPDAGEISSG